MKRMIDLYWNTKADTGELGLSRSFMKLSPYSQADLLKDWIKLLSNKYHKVFLMLVDETLEARPSHGTAVAAPVLPPSAVVTSNKKRVAAVAPAPSKARGGR